MAVPKRRTSKARHRKRHAHWMALAAVKLVRCKHCGQRHQPHAVCPYCGWYEDRQVTEPRIEALS